MMSKSGSRSRRTLPEGNIGPPGGICWRPRCCACDADGGRARAAMTMTASNAPDRVMTQPLSNGRELRLAISLFTSSARLLLRGLSTTFWRHFGPLVLAMHGKSGRPSSSGVRKNRGGRLPTSLTCNALREHHAHELHGEALHGFGLRALRPWLWRTLLPAAGLDPSGQASPAERQPCRTAGARFTAARVLGRGRRRAWSVAGEQTGNTATTRAKRRRNGRACGPQCLLSAICAC
jgi:hypothetical protein